MRKIVVSLVLLLSLSFTLQAANFSKVAEGTPHLIQEGSQKMWCPVCGMNLKMFYKTSHAVVLKDGKKKQYCSIRCLVADWPIIKDKIKEILVVDAKTGELINAKSAYYVVGSKVKGTMSMVSKIAFAKEKDAKAFQQKFGGKISDFNRVFKIASESLNKDSMMVAKKKQMKMYPMGKKIYTKMCKPIDVKGFSHINELKAAIRAEKLCKPMKEKQLQAVALYLWNVKRVNTKRGCNCGMMRQNSSCNCNMNKMNMKGCRSSANMGQVASKMGLTKTDKCPVCGMFVYKYPKWAAFIYYEQDGKSKYLAFDGVKDMMKFYFEPVKWGKYENIKNSIKKILVRDYYTLKPVLAESAWYVVGSNVFGPMGNELIPFKTEEAAKNFMADHKGKKILRFNDITKEIVYKLDE
ncbi:nitrous oxide reductase accessory protein NosL [Hydrogenimonas thermophila]|uniref:Nitrous oxide reductase accessory protein NosL n=1 Tax=Hydrogenimonas thermophila TaxID=223786 RepID=A0A1I5TZL1_9BACT|nr:nitrous oxide reductase accessory protein NosL [Hydrogenimonas thermophila]SFP87746.1 Nitrous oxide reductase accessory protein NosL [Hydrogenimonas thermophila]